MPEASTCRSCGARILWVRTAAGNVIPLDANPAPDGNFVIKDGVAIVASDCLWAPMLEGPYYVSHFSTCPEAKKWRKS